jgi:hypothetical protein
MPQIDLACIVPHADEIHVDGMTEVLGRCLLA